MLQEAEDSDESDYDSVNGRTEESDNETGVLSTEEEEEEDEDVGNLQGDDEEDEATPAQSSARTPQERIERHVQMTARFDERHINDGVAPLAGWAQFLLEWHSTVQAPIARRICDLYRDPKNLPPNPNLNYSTDSIWPRAERVYANGIRWSLVGTYSRTP